MTNETRDTLEWVFYSAGFVAFLTAVSVGGYFFFALSSIPTEFEPVVSDCRPSYDGSVTVRVSDDRKSIITTKDYECVVSKKTCL